MSLERMTRDWSRIADSIAKFVYDERKKTIQGEDDLSPLSVYNNWIHKTGIVIDELDLAIWAINHIKSQQKLPPELLEESVEEDEERGLGLCQKKSTIPTSKNK